MAIAEIDAARRALLDRQAITLAQRLMAQPQALGVAIMGGAARYECAWGTVEGHDELFSDIELLLVTQRPLREVEQSALRADLDTLAASFGHANPRFHVDFLVRPHYRLRSLPPFVFTYELVANGRTLAGRPMLDRVRPVGLTNLDRQNTREILLKRLWALAEGLPSAWLRGQLLDRRLALCLTANLARQPLDTTTVLLPEAGILRPTYRQRIECWRRIPDLPFREMVDRALGMDSALYLEQCLVRRSELEPLPDPTVEWERVVACLEASLAWLLACPREAVATFLPNQSRRLFHEWPVTLGQWRATVREALRLARSLGARRAGRWLAAPRKGILAAALLELHRAMIDHQERNAVLAERRLGRAACFAATLDDRTWLAPYDAGESFVERWLSVRWILGRSFWRIVRLGEPAAWQRIASQIA